MSISLVMPAYNAEAFLRPAIDSVLAQTHTAWELIVVDDGSTDATAQIVESYGDSRIRLIRQPAKSGPSAARWQGTLAASNPLISYFDADDVLCPDTLDVLKKALEDQPEAVLSYADFVRINEKGRRTGVRRFLPSPQRPSGDVLEKFLSANFMPNGGCALVKRDAVLTSRAWEKNLRCGGDWVAWTLLATIGPFLHVPNFVAMEYRELRTGISQTVSTTFENFLPSIDAIYDDARIVAKFPAEKLASLRSERLAHLWFFIASLHIRRGRYVKSLGFLIRAIKSYPAMGPGFVARYGVAFADAVV